MIHFLFVKSYTTLLSIVLTELIHLWMHLTEVNGLCASKMRWQCCSSDVFLYDTKPILSCSELFWNYSEGNYFVCTVCFWAAYVHYIHVFFLPPCVVNVVVKICVKIESVCVQASLCVWDLQCKGISSAAAYLHQTTTCRNLLANYSHINQQS